MKHRLTVGKLIERLTQYDRETLVMVRGDDHSYRIAYVTDGLAERDDAYSYSEAQLGDDKAGIRHGELKPGLQAASSQSM